jgi:hypothetical protein
MGSIPSTAKRKRKREREREREREHREVSCILCVIPSMEGKFHTTIAHHHSWQHPPVCILPDLFRIPWIYLDSFTGR